MEIRLTSALVEIEVELSWGWAWQNHNGKDWNNNQANTKTEIFKSSRIIRKSNRHIKEKGVAGKEFNRKEYVEPKNHAKQQGKSEENDKQKWNKKQRDE